MKFIPISNTTLAVFIPTLTATHAITSTYILQSLKVGHRPAWETSFFFTSLIVEQGRLLSLCVNTYICDLYILQNQSSF